MNQARCTPGAFVLAFLATVAITSSAGAQMPTVQGRPSFAADVINQLNAQNEPVAIVHVAIPYSELVFVKVGESYKAACEVTIAARAKGRSVSSTFQTLRATVGSYVETHQDTLKLTDTEEFPLKPGSYVFEVSVLDLETQGRGKVRLPLEIENLRKRDGTLSPLSLGHLKPGVQPEDATAADVITNPSRVFGHDEPFTAVSGEVYLGEKPRANAAAETTWTLAYKVTDDMGTLRLRGTHAVRRTGIATPFVLTPNLAWLTLGSYTLEVHALPDGPIRSTTFQVDESLVDLENDYTRLVDMVAYIASGRELDSLRTAQTLDERRLLWDRFWARRNPDPKSPRNPFKAQYFQRVRYANAHYSAGEEGWRSDRGRIYIKFGAPDQIEDEPMTAYQPAYQLWRYFRARAVFLFADRDGFGRYVLVNASRGE
jgi:GWxTD domain-containing protein